MRRRVWLPVSTSSSVAYQVPTAPVRIGLTSILPVSSVRDLGVYLDADADATMTTHVKATVRSCFMKRINDDVAGRQRLRSCDVTTLVVPSTATVHSQLAASIPSKTWNRLPASVRAATSLSAFSQELKTFLFRSSYWTLSLTCFTLAHFSDHQHTFYWQSKVPCSVLA